MRSFRILEHRADLRLALQGETLEELLRAGLEGLNQVLKPEFCQEGKALPLRERFRIEAPDATALLVDFLSEVLTRAHVHRAVYCTADLRLRGETLLEAELAGAPVEAFSEDVKAVTYHEAEVIRDPERGYSTGLVLDV